MSNHAQLMAREIRDPYTQLLVNLSGENGREWLTALKRFLRKEHPWLKPPADLSILDKSVEEIFTPEAVLKHGVERGKTTISRVLKAEGINTIRDLMEYSEDRLLRFVLFGPKYVGVIRGVLEEHGLQLDVH